MEGKKKHWSHKLRDENAQLRTERNVLFQIVKKNKVPTTTIEEVMVVSKVGFEFGAEEVIWAGSSTKRNGAGLP